MNTTGTEQGDINAGLIQNGTYQGQPSPTLGSVPVNSNPTPHTPTPHTPTLPTSGVPNPTDATNPPPTGLFSANPQPGSNLNYYNFLQGAVTRLNSLNPLIQSKNLLIKQLYDTPITPDELNSLPDAVKQAVQTGNRPDMELMLRTMNDQIAGRNNTLNQSVQFLATQYNDSINQLETQRQNALSNVTSTLQNFITNYTNQGFTLQEATQAATQYLTNLYGPQYVAQLQNMGIDIGSLANAYGPGTSPGSNYVTSQDNNPLNITLGPATQKYVDSGQATVKQANGLSFLSFKDPSVGLQAAKDLLFAPNGTYWNMTVDQALKKWSNNGYGGEIVKGKGVDPAAFIRDLPADQRNILIDAMKTAEGGSTGTSGQSTILPQYADLLTKLPQSKVSYFNSLSPNDQADVYQLVTGNALLSDLVRSRGGSGTALIARLSNEATQIDPSFSINENKIRYNFMRAWNNPSSSPFQTRLSVNTALGHMAQAYTDFKSINNSTLQHYNSLANMLKSETGDPSVASFNYDISQLAAEIAKVYKGGTAPSQEEIDQERQALTSNLTPTQGQAVFDRAAKLMSSKITSMAEEYRTSMGQYPDQPIVQNFALQELISSGINAQPILDTLKGQGYDVSQYQSSGSPSGTGSTYKGFTLPY